MAGKPSTYLSDKDVMLLRLLATDPKHLYDDTKPPFASKARARKLSQAGYLAAKPRTPRPTLTGFVYHLTDIGVDELLWRGFL